MIYRSDRHRKRCRRPPMLPHIQTIYWMFVISAFVATLLTRSDVPLFIFGLNIRIHASLDPSDAAKHLRLCARFNRQLPLCGRIPAPPVDDDLNLSRSQRFYRNAALKLRH